MERQAVAETQRTVARLITERLRLEAAREGKSVELEHACERQASLLTCQSIVQSVVQAIQQQIHTKIADVVTQCLQIVFGEDGYAFRIKFEQKRGKTEAVLVFERDGIEVDPLTASGGGVIDVAAFALRLAALALTRPPVRRVVIFDEPFRFVSRGYWPGLVKLIEHLGVTLAVQFIIVTHCPELRCGNVVEIE